MSGQVEIDRRMFDPGVFAAVVLAVAAGIVSPSAAQTEEAAPEPPGQPLPAVEALDIGAVEARTGALLLSGQAGGDVDGALTWSVGQRDEDGLLRVPFVVEVDGASLLEGRIGRNVVIGLYAYVVDDDGKVIDHIAQGLVLDAEVYAKRIIDDGLKFVGRFDLPSGDYALRVMVRNQRTAAFFMSWSLMSLPDVEHNGPQLLPPLFPDQSSGWTIAHQTGGESAVALGESAEFLPSARPVLIEDRTADVWLGGGGWSDDARVDVRIINELGRTVSEPMVVLDDRTVGDFAFRKATLSPVDLPPGRYTLVVTVSNDRTGQVLRRGTQVVVAGNEAHRTWVLARRAEAGGARPADVAEAEEAPKLSKREIRLRYRAALRLLGKGDAVAARRQIADLERTVISDHSPKAPTVLGEAEYAESKEIAKQNPLALMPMALLHRELYRSYMARQEGALGFHARKMTITYAEQLARLKPQNGFSEGLMVNLAADLAQAGASSAARDLLEQTLRVSPGYRAALLSLGFSYERNGEYIEAVTTYERLVDTHRGFDEGLLRLGINRIRIGRDGQGLEVLQALVDGEAKPWIRTVAAQEIVRLLVGKDLPEEAERAARAAISRMPEDQRLKILLAAILERTGRYAEAITTASELPPASRGVSPRARYAEWPSLGLRASQTHLATRAAEALPALQSAVATGGVG